MRVWPLVLALSGLLSGGCLQHSRITALNLPELSADSEPLPFTESRSGGFYGGTFPGKIPVGQRDSGLFTYELYYLLTVADGRADTLCREAGFKLHGIVAERRQGELAGIRFLKELTGRLRFTPDGVIPSGLSASSSFSIPDPARAIQTAPDQSGAAFAVRYQPPGAEPANALSLVFELRLNPYSLSTTTTE
jgi:hypothetical protein